MVYSHRVFIILMLGCMMWICTCYNMEAKIRERAYKGALMMLNGRLKQVGINAENQYTMLADIIIPLWKYTYDEQLVVKQTHAYNFMNIFRNYANTSGIVGDLSKIIASPAPKHYRNRDDLSIFYNINGDKKIIGHYIERNSDFLPVCVAPVNITTIKPRTMEIIRMLQNFLDISPLPASASFNSFGFWRGAVVHSTGKGDIMIIVQTNSGLMTPAEMEVEIENLRNYVAKMEPNSTLYNQVYTYSTQLSMLGLPYILLLHGEPYMYDYIENYKFKISPGVKFPVNTQSGEVLYREVFRLAGLKKDNIILDLYCGIGIISILAADKVRASIGIDESPSNIEEAKANALLNNVTNTIFMAGYINKIHTAKT